MSGPPYAQRVSRVEELTARALAAQLAAVAWELQGRPLQSGDVLVRRYFGNRTHPDTAPVWDLVVVLVERDMSGAVVTQVRSMFPREDGERGR